MRVSEIGEFVGVGVKQLRRAACHRADHRVSRQDVERIGLNVFAERPERYPEVTLDEVAAARPEVILLPDEPYRFRKAHIQDFAPYEDVPAVRDGRIHLVDGKLLAWYGPRIGEALQTLPSLLHF